MFVQTINTSVRSFDDLKGKGDTKTLSLINSGLREITQDGTVERIMGQWQGKRVAEVQPLDMLPNAGHYELVNILYQYRNVN